MNAAARVQRAPRPDPLQLDAHAPQPDGQLTNAPQKSPSAKPKSKPADFLELLHAVHQDNRKAMQKGNLNWWLAKPGIRFDEFMVAIDTNVRKLLPETKFRVSALNETAQRLNFDVFHPDADRRIFAAELRTLVLREQKLAAEDHLSMLKLKMEKDFESTYWDRIDLGSSILERGVGELTERLFRERVLGECDRIVKDWKSVQAKIKETERLFAPKKEKSRISPPGSDIDPDMELRTETEKAFKGTSYVPPSRAAKKGYTVYLSTETAQELKDAAHLRGTTITKMFEEAIEGILEKERPRINAVRDTLKKLDRT